MRAIADTIGARELPASLPILEAAAARGVEWAMVRLLRVRAAMLDLLEADVNLMSQDLDLLIGEVLARDTAQSSADR